MESLALENTLRSAARTRRTAALLGAAASLIALTAVASSPKHSDTQPVDESSATALASAQTVLATIADQRLTEADVIAQDKDDFDNLDTDSEIRRHQQQVKEAEARYNLIQRQTDKILDQKALEAEAKARGTTTDAVMADIKVPVVTDTEARTFYESHKARANGRTFEQLQSEVTQYLANEHNNQAKRAFLNDLRAKHQIVSLLPPYRLTVEAVGPSKGKAHAPVTIVEFGDFQCPFCRQAEAAVATVLQNHPDDVRFVFRELPLTGIHPLALGAAHAAVCADQQGKFWPMHDAMYADQAALAQDALIDTAKRLGLDGDRFSACLAGAADKTVRDDARAADELNIDETPYFFINGRPLHGSIPADQLEAVITNELHRLALKHG